MNSNDLKKLELDKILRSAANYAVSEGGKAALLKCEPACDVPETRRRLDCTEEASALLYVYGIGKVEYFKDLKPILISAEKGATLFCSELLDACALLRSARCVYESIAKTDENEIKIIRSISEKIYFDRGLEDDIQQKIISVDGVSDYASDKLYSIRNAIKNLNEKIRAKLAEYLSKDRQYLQDGIVTIRNDRFVIPVKAEYKNIVKGFVHDRSQSGATFFIEPEYVLELNNELKALLIDEREEVEAVLRSLSARLGSLSGKLIADMEILAEIDSYLARAEYAYSLKCVKPKVNAKGYINIIKGRHPLIDKDKNVPVSVELGGGYDFLLLSGANTGGKTVTLKMCGLFCAMAACGLYIPAAEGSTVAVFDGIFCDVGDSQSIEDSLSTFSSHLKNVIRICNNADANSLVLMDELGGGTNPDEGQALAKAVIKHLLNRGCRGIVTTHFTQLKEFAYNVDRLENAGMEFDARTLKPLYSIKIGLPSASNALYISRKLGLDEKILKDAESYMSDGARSYDGVLKRAEESRVQAEEKLLSVQKLEAEWRVKLDELNGQIDKLNREKEKFNRNVRSESRRIISERCEKAEEIVAQIEEIFKKENLSQADLINARTLKNKLGKISVEDEEVKNNLTAYDAATRENLKNGQRVFVKKLQSFGQVTDFSPFKKEAEVICNGMKLHCKISELLIAEEKQTPVKVTVVKNIPLSQPLLEINVLGMTVEEALYEVENFIDKAVTDNLEEIKIIHGVGTGRLRSAITQRLKTHKNVESFRAGKYGEGETGVTIIKLK